MACTAPIYHNANISIMKRLLYIIPALALLVSCQKEKKEMAVETEETVTEKPVAFTSKKYEQKTTLPCTDACTNVVIDVPVAENIPQPAKDSINNKIFNTVRGIVYFGEQPTTGKTYEEIMASFIKSYEDLRKDFPKEKMAPWEAKINGSIAYQTENIINVKLENYMFTGGAHGYSGNRSLIFNAKTGTTVNYAEMFTDQKAVTAMAEKKFRDKYKIPAGKNINSTGYFFENDKFILPQNIFYTEDGLLLYYNAYEVASYAEQQKEITLTYAELGGLLKVK